MARRFKHLTKTDRLRIEAHTRDGLKPKEIAEILGVHISTIYRELKRGRYTHRNSDWTEEERYSPDIAEERYRENLRAKGPQLKIGKDHKLAEYIEGKIADEKYSPEAVLEEIKVEGIQFNTTLSKNTVYSYIEKGVFLRLTNKDLPVKGTKKRGYHTVKKAARPPKGESIEKRPEEIDKRETFGHWEMDTVVSARPCKKVLLVLTERLTRKEIVRQLVDKSAASVVRALDDLEKRYGEMFPVIFKSITCDNGTEFSDYEGIERSAEGEDSRTKTYYCHPYSSWERGSNENLNKMIRRWLPKGTSFEDVTDEQVQQIENWMNKYPRGILGFASAEAAYQEQMAALFGAH
jgi:IS30 family transposase